MKKSAKSKPAFTPGWYRTQSEDDAGSTWTIRRCEDSTVIATVQASKGRRSVRRAEADARLLEKAPRMYEVLKVLHKAAEEMPAKKRAEIWKAILSAAIIISNIENGEIIV